ncbi:HAD family hydrolase [Alkaliphilus peptidifermentans]|uniref:Haloacid dehalogenase superfamily, subfamily IA, variant 3 with third motif having DD or ED/haloacid dehalogenase superfamily, subfamily IA, variant 1 with third motif having Dx(3-4)D or Dx(3-4)E n=1 Tax=Alkaliphilus peptidifermentans DSM 18978 TaxID=1120976 RepID=A0A1G5HR53_9FIRM|nr:HAD family phosphatase [Alkaliphilus peptidifermentans]SCY66161.1 haloacid dehalogenase superfamily, subfamily IA, variant 3 with third motif having DD or ED/haloacid dehalogenase superfamily, subfamily IA, variant 1 with third motif having Dx(3-4)D or Dx(3-4)E [Alkaliphilus peptidifermentans DSM 18978]
MDKIELVIFDMDGLMFDTETLSKGSWKIVGEKHGFIFSDELFNEVIGLNIKATENVFKQAYGDDFPYVQLKEEKNKIMMEEIKKSGIGIKKGLKECIKYLKGNNILIAIASSSRRATIDFYLESANLLNEFDFIISGQEVANGKPSPEIFLACCEKLNVKKENTLVLEDSINGIKAAYDGNIKVIYIPDLVKIPEEIEKLTHQNLTDLLLVPEFIENINKVNCKNQG